MAILPAIPVHWQMRQALKPKMMDRTTKGRLQRLASERQDLIREMEAAAATAPRLVRGGDGVFRVTATNTCAHALFKRCYDDDWVDPDFDWMTWIRSAEGNELYTSRAKRRAASLEQIGHLLTTLVRQDHFTYGAWDAAVRSGLLMDVVERAASLCAQR